MAKRISDIDPQVVHAAFDRRQFRTQPGNVLDLSGRRGEERLGVVTGLKNSKIAAQPPQPQVGESADEQTETTGRRPDHGKQGSSRTVQRHGGQPNGTPAAGLQVGRCQ